MSLRIRRGTDAQRQTLTFDQGEVVYTTDTKKLYLGDGMTAGGTNILSTSAGAGVTFNATTQQFDFNTVALGLTTSDVSEGTRKYFTTQRAQDAAASLFTATGSPSSSGTISGTIATGTIVLASADASLVQGSRMVISGAGGNGILAGTYYVVSAVGTSVVLANSLANATNGTAITGINTGSVTGTTYTAGGTDSGITFTYDSVNHVMNVVSSGSGTTSLINDTNPRLGANLNILNYNITSSGTGIISITGNITSNATVTGTTLTAGNLSLAGNSLSVTSGSLLVKNSLQNIVEFRGRTADGLIANTPQINLYSSRGTIASPVANQAGDYVVSLNFGGYNAGLYQQTSTIISQYDASANMANAFPGSNLAFITNNGAGQNIAYLDSKGVFNAPIFLATSYTTTNMNAITSPIAGMIIFNSTANKFYGYNGTSWVAFTGP